MIEINGLRNKCLMLMGRFGYCLNCDLCDYWDYLDFQ